MWSWGSDSSGDGSPVKVEGLPLWLVPVLGVLLLGIASVFDLRKIFTKTPGQAGGAPHLTSSRLQRVKLRQLTFAWRWRCVNGLS